MQKIFILLCLFSLSNNLEAVSAASIKSIGMGVTSVANPLDSLAMAVNPASGSWVPNRWDGEAYCVYYNGFSKVSNNYVLTPNGPILNPLTNTKQNAFYSSHLTPSAAGGINYHYNENLAFGLVSYNRNYAKTSYKHPNLLLGTSKLGTEYINLTISPFLSYAINCSNSIGVSVNWQLARLKVNGLENFDNVLFSRHPGFVTNRGYNYANGVGASVGWLGSLSDQFRFGLSWSSRARMRFKKYQGFAAQNGRVDVPEIIRAGFAWDFAPGMTFAFEYEFEHWSALKSIHNPLNLTLQQSIAQPLGSKNGSGFGWKDKHSYRAGLQYAYDCNWSLRAGGGYIGSGVRNSQTPLNALLNDISEYFVALGATRSIDSNNELSIYLSSRIYRKVKGKNVIPQFLGGGDVSVSEIKSGFGLAYGRLF
jgi:long-chain fatty acid transport protein